MPKFNGKVPLASKQSNPFNIKKLLKCSSWEGVQQCLPQNWLVTETTFVNGRISSLHIDLNKNVDIHLFNRSNRDRWTK